MAYATVTDVEREVGLGFQTSADSIPSQSQVREFLERNSRELDRWLRQNYFTLPISGADALSALEDINAVGAAIQVLEVRPAKDDRETVDRRLESLREQYKQYLIQLETNPALLLNHTTRTEKVGEIPRRKSHKLSKIIPHPEIWHKRAIRDDSDAN